MEKPKTTRNHFLPITYQKNFFNKNETLYIYQKGEKFFQRKTLPEERILPVVGEKALKEFGVQNRLYHFDKSTDSNVDPNAIEDFFTSEIDDQYTNLLTMVKDRDIHNKNFESGLRFAVATAMVRTPDFKMRSEEVSTKLHKLKMKKVVEDEDCLEEWRKDYENRTGDKITAERMEQIKKSISEEGYNLKWGNNLFLTMAFLSLRELDGLFSKMNLSIVQAPQDGFFITSDAPVVYFVPKEKVNFYNGPKNLTSPWVEVYFPLSKEYCVFLHYRNSAKKYVKLDRETCRKIVNYNTAQHSRDIIISPYRASFLDKYVEKYVPYPFSFTPTIVPGHQIK